MNVALGAALLSATVLLFAWTYGQYRRPNPKAWTRGGSMAAFLTLINITLFAFGLAFLVKFAVDVGAESRWAEGVAVAAVGAALCWFFVPRLTAPARSKPQTPPQPAMPRPANDPNARRTASPGGPARKPDRRRAA